MTESAWARLLATWDLGELQGLNILLFLFAFPLTGSPVARADLELITQIRLAYVSEISCLSPECWDYMHCHHNWLNSEYSYRKFSYKMWLQDLYEGQEFKRDRKKGCLRCLLSLWIQKYIYDTRTLKRAILHYLRHGGGKALHSLRTEES